MSTSRRLIIPGPRLPIGGGDYALSPDEQRYLRKVLRLRIGATLAVRDGAGHEWDAVLIDRHALRLSPRRTLKRPKLPQTTLNFCPPKGRRLDLLVEKATELGCFALRPIRTERSVRIMDEPTERILAIAKAAAAQCGAAWLPAIHDACALDDAVRATTHHRFIAHPQGQPFGLALDTNDLPDQVEIFTGPEGGFTDIEVQDAIGAGATAVSLGPTILRAETAPIVALAMVHALSWRG